MSTGTLSRKCERSKSLCLQAKKKKKKKRCQLSSAHLWITAQPRVLPWRCASPSASHLPGKALRESVEGAGFCLPERLRRIKPSEEQTAAPPCSASAPRGRRLLSEEVFLADVATAAPAPGGSLFAPESQLTKNSSQTRLEEPEPPPRGSPAGLSGEMEPLSRGPRCARGEAGDRNNPRAHRSAQGMAQFPGGKEETGHPPKPLPALIRTRIVPQTHPKTWSSERRTHPSSHSSTNVVFERSLCCKAG